MIKSVKIITDKDGSKLLHTTEINGHQKLYEFVNENFYRGMVTYAMTPETAREWVIVAREYGWIKEADTQGQKNIKKMCVRLGVINEARRNGESTLEEEKNFWREAKETTEGRLLMAILGINPKDIDDDPFNGRPAPLWENYCGPSGSPNAENYYGGNCSDNDLF